MHREGRRISTIYFSAGGYGALDGFDGLAATPAPSNMIGSPTEVFEQHTSISVLSKRILPDTGGAGRHPGGPGQEIVLRNDTENPLSIACFGGRTLFPARGVAGGREGALRQHRLNGELVDSKGRYILAPGDTIGVREAGGAGFGEPRERPVEALAADLAAGHVSVEGVRREYGVDLAAAAKRPRAAAE